MQYLSQQAVQRLEQKMSQTQLQSLDILAMSSIELAEKISKEIAENPVLDIIKDPLYTKKIPKAPSENTTLSSYRKERRLYKSNEAIQVRDKFNSFLENIPDTYQESLQNHLLAQLHTEQLPPALTTAAELIIQNLDENGFHLIPLAELFHAELQQNPEIKQIIRIACNRIRRFDPLGCAVQNFKESLFVQAALLFHDKKETSPVVTYTLDILKNHFSYLEKARPYSLAHAINSDKTIPYKINTETAEEILKLIATLEPFPGSKYTRVQTEYIVPTAFVETENGNIKITINDAELPQLSISAELTALEKNTHNSTVKEYLKPQLQQAKKFIGSLNQREKTILNVIQAIVNIQKQFFVTGEKKTLVPLTQQDIAHELSVHESTISRTVSNKYLQCEWGLFELKYFFASASATQSGETTSSHTKESLKALITEITKTHEKKLSDQKISDILTKTYGIQLARRTINKYRKELKIS